MIELKYCSFGVIQQLFIVKKINHADKYFIGDIPLCILIVQSLKIFHIAGISHARKRKSLKTKLQFKVFIYKLKVNFWLCEEIDCHQIYLTKVNKC
jgi:hypothetical protein